MFALFSYQTIWPVLCWSGTLSLNQLALETLAVSYTIAIDGVAVPPDNITVLSNTSYIVSGLEANRMYTASMRTVISNCISDQTNVIFQIMARSELFPSNLPFHLQLYQLIWLV
jgi:hypothetical protein